MNSSSGTNDFHREVYYPQSSGNSHKHLILINSVKTPYLMNKHGRAYGCTLFHSVSATCSRMILGTATSVNGVPIRLTDERWEHILDSHPNLASFQERILEAVENPDYILASRRGAPVAVVVLGRRAFLQVFYIEKSQYDGFVLSARIAEKLDRAKIKWRKENQEA